MEAQPIKLEKTNIIMTNNLTHGGLGKVTMMKLRNH